MPQFIASILLILLIGGTGIGERSRTPNEPAPSHSEQGIGFGIEGP